MQKILVILVTIFSVSGQAQAIDDACFECTYLSQAMRWMPKSCTEAKEALSGFDEQSLRLMEVTTGASPGISSWAKTFTNENRDTMVSHVNRLCKNA